MSTAYNILDRTGKIEIAWKVIHQACHCQIVVISDVPNSNIFLKHRNHVNGKKCSDINLPTSIEAQNRPNMLQKGPPNP